MIRDPTLIQIRFSTSGIQRRIGRIGDAVGRIGDAVGRIGDAAVGPEFRVAYVGPKGPAD